MARLDSSVFPELSESAVAKLHSSRIYTVYDFITAKGDELMKSGLKLKKLEQIKEFFSTKFSGELANTTKLYEQELARKTIPTGIQNLDALLEGGFRCGAIYEICGSSSAGKSQLCHWLSVHATSDDEPAEVHYIDGSTNFCVSRIQMMLDSRQCDNTMIGHVMSSIKVHQICKISDLISVFHHLSNEDQSKCSKKLIIVDSLSVLCSVVTKENLNPHLDNFASLCRYIVKHFNAVILIVNTVRTRQVGAFLAEQEDGKKFALEVRPSLGNYWLEVPDVRLLMTQEENGHRKIAVWESKQLELDNSCSVNIKDEGIFPIYLSRMMLRQSVVYSGNVISLVVEL